MKQARHHLQKAAEQNHPAGCYYAYVHFIDTDRKQALEYLKKSADLGFPDAQLTWAQQLSNGYHLQNDPTSAFAYNLSAFNNETSSPYDKAEAAFRLGQACLHGMGTTKDETRAFSLLKQAADADHAQALATLGFMYSPSPSKSCSSSSSSSFPPDSVKAYECFEKSAVLGNRYAQFNVALFLYYGWPPLEKKDMKKAVYWLERSASCHYSEACFLLGQLYETEEAKDVIPQDLKKARELYSRGSSKQHVGCMVQLAGLYLEGKGCEKDEQQAFELYERAAKLGSQKAAEEMSVMLAKGFVSKPRTFAEILFGPSVSSSSSSSSSSTSSTSSTSSSSSSSRLSSSTVNK
jgi:TPR repeat protein